MSSRLKNLYEQATRFLNHVADYESFGGANSVNSLAIGHAGHAFLRKLGVELRVTSSPQTHRVGSSSNFELNISRVEESVLKLESFESLLDLLEQGLKSGVLSVDSGRFFISVGQIGEQRLQTYDISPALTRSSIALKTREAAPVLNNLLNERSDGAGSGQRFVRAHESEAHGHRFPVNHTENATSTRGKISQFLRAPEKDASEQSVKGGSIFRVVGEEVVLPEGIYVPVEHIENSLPRSNESTTDGSRQILLPKARIFDIDVGPIVNAGSKSASSSMPSAEQIDLAWRLVKDLSDSEAGSDQLEGSLRLKLESLLGTNLAHVRLQSGPAADFVTSVLGAEALTSERTVIIPTRNLAASDGEPSSTLVHELVHVKQHAENRTTAPREDLEAEAHGTASALFDGSSPFLLANKQNPVPMRTMDAPQDVHMEWSDFQDGRGNSQAYRRLLDASMETGRRSRLMSEVILEKLTDHFHWERKREKEEYKDRVF